MADNLTDVLENELLDISVGNSGSVATTPVKAHLMTANGDDASAGTEVSGGSYAAQNITFSAASSGSLSNNAVVSYADMPAVTVVGVELRDSTGKRLWHLTEDSSGNPISKATSAGDTLEIGVGELSLTMA